MMMLIMTEDMTSVCGHLLFSNFMTVMTDNFREILEIDGTPTWAVVEGGFIRRN
jgi:hypothetical protein